MDHGPLTLEDLGTRNIAGVDTVGIRETYRIEVGAMGNDQPMTSMKEEWHSRELGINVLSIRSGPAVGKQTFTVVELTASEPDPQLFELPPGYKVSDQRKNPPISWSRRHSSQRLRLAPWAAGLEGTGICANGSTTQ